MILYRINWFFIVALILLAFVNSYSKGYGLVRSKRSKYPAIKVFLKNGSILTDNSKDFYRPISEFLFLKFLDSDDQISDDDYRKLITVSGRKILPGETDSIQVNFLTGIPYKNTWIFRILEGPIETYTPLTYWSFDEFSHFRIEGGPIEPRSDFRIEQFLRDREKELKAGGSSDTSYIYNSNAETIHEAILEYNKHFYSQKFIPATKLPIWVKKSESVFRVYMKNGEIATDYFTIRHGFKRWVQYWIKNRYVKIMPNETDSVVVNFLTGFPQDSTWLFKVISGKISAFMPLPMQEVRKFTHIQKEGDSIQKYSHKLLEQYLSDDKKALSALYEIDTIKGRTFTYYRPREAIMEYNSQSVTKRRLIDSLLAAASEEESTEKIEVLCNQAIDVDSSALDAYLLLGNNAMEANDNERAYQHYTLYLRYCRNERQITRVRRKIEKMNKPIIY